MNAEDHEPRANGYNADRACLIHAEVVSEISRKSCKMPPLLPLDIVDLFNLK
jgi:hypothetical protein